MPPSRGGSLCTPGVLGWPAVILGLCIWVALVAQSAETTSATPVPGCGETYTGDGNNVSISITSHIYAPWGCTWTFTVTEGKFAALLLEKYMYLRGSGNCSKEYIKIYAGTAPDESHLLQVLCGYLPSGSAWMSTTNSLFVEYHNDGLNGKFDANVKYLALNSSTPDCGNVVLTGQEGSLAFPIPFETFGVVQKGQCRWVITVDPGYVIQLAFDKFDVYSDTSAMISATYAPGYDFMDPCAIFESGVKIYDGQTEGDTVVAKLCEAVRRWLITSTTNSLLVVATMGGTESGLTRGSLRAHYMAVPASEVNRNCGDRTLSGTGGVIATPNFPNNYDNLLDCKWLITVEDGYSIQITASQYFIENSPNCMYDSVQIMYTDSILGPRMLPTTCGSYNSSINWMMGPYTSLSNQMFIKFVTNWNTTSTGFNATWTRVCGKTILSYTTGGTIQSPLYPQDYPGDQHCEYKFGLSKPGEKLVLSFNNFQLEQPAANGSCVNDYLEIAPEYAMYLPTASIPPELSKETRRYCGGSLPPEFTSYSTLTNVRFVSNSNVSAPGFQLIYNFYTAANCGQSLFTNALGTIHSPGYPGTFPSYTDCNYTIRATQGQTIHLQFDFWNMGGYAMTFDCSLANGGARLDIFNGEGTAVTHIATFCNPNEFPLPVISSAGAMTLLFRSSHNAMFSFGFSATYTATVKVWGRCASDDNCEDVNAACMNGFCICHSGFAVSANLTCVMADTGCYESDAAECLLPLSSLANFDVNTALQKDIDCACKLAKTAIDCAGARLSSCSPGSVSPVIQSWYDNVTTIYSQYSAVCSANFDQRQDCELLPGKVDGWCNQTFPCEDLHAGCDNNTCVCQSPYQKANMTPSCELYQTTTVQHATIPTTSSTTELYNTTITQATTPTNVTGSTSDCGNVALTGQEGSLAFPGPFEMWEVVQKGQCRWVITVDPGYVIQLAFDNFDVYSDTSAVVSATYSPGYDFMDPCTIFESDVKIYDGQTEGDTVVAKLCTAIRPWLITSTTNSILVVATMGGTESGLTRGSLRAHYVAVPAAEVKRNCGNRTLSGTGGVIASPNFPNNYDNLLDCEWLITVEDGYSIQITSLQYAVESWPNCMYDSVQIMYSDSILGPRLLQPTCGSYNSSDDWRMNALTSLSNLMFIKFVTNWNTTSTGFNVTWTRVCGKTLLSYTTGRTVQSPQYPQDYPGDQHCEYKFGLSKPGEKLVLRFNKFQLEQPAADGSCVNDYLEIAPEYAKYLHPTSIHPELSTETRRYCGDSLPPEFTSYSILTNVRFVTNSDISAPGFQLSYNFYTATDCGQSLFTKTSGTIHSPGYPGSFPSYTECNYTVRATQGQTIHLQFDFLNVGGYTMRSECSLANQGALLEIFDGEGTAGTHIATFCNTDEFPHPVISSASAAMTLRFRSSHNSMFSFGFSATYTAATEVLPGKVDGWCNETSPCEDLHAGCDNNTCVCQSPYQKANMTPSCELYDTTTPQQTSIPSTTDATTTELNDTMTPQQTSIHSTAPTTTTEQYHTTTAQDNTNHTTSPTTTAELYNTTTVQYTTIPTTSSTTELYNTTIVQSTTPTNVTGSTAELYNTTTVQYTPIPTTSSTTELYNTTITQATTPTNVTGSTVAFQGCGGELTGTGGVITSPTFPDDYPNDVTCTWILQGQPGDVIRLSFSEFQLEDEDYCSNDWLEMRDGREEWSSRLDRLCGDAIPLDVTSTGNVMRVQFSSNFQNSFKGFKASWTSVCEQFLRSSSGYVSSPSNTGISKRCSYIIESPDRWWDSSYVIRLEFQSFQLGGNANNCQNNYLEVRDGGLESSPVIGQRHCGNGIPSAITSSQEMMRILYVTDGSAVNGGFSATYSRETPTCGSYTLTADKGTIQSPGYPHNYPNQINCAWEIVAAENHKIKLTFGKFLLEGPSEYCPWDWVKIIDGDQTSGPYCGASVPDTITSTGNRLTVVFYADWIITYYGFSADYVTYDPASDQLTRQYALYPFGTENGDEQLAKGNSKVEQVRIKTGFPVDKELQRKIFIGTKGVVSFGYREYGKKFDLRSNKDMICVYNADIRDKDSDDGGVYYQLHTDNAAVLTKASNEVREFTDLKDYTASLVLVVTWHRLRHARCSHPDAERATVQLALVSNGQRSFGLVYYQTGAMKWPYLREEPLVIGMSVGDRVEENIYSGTREAFISLDTISGNTGRQGTWIYDIGDSYSADQACQDWYTRNLPLHSLRQQEFKRLPECPCHWWMLWGNWRWSHWRDGYGSFCFRMTTGSSRSVEPHGKECCYNYNWWSWNWEDWGQFLSDAPNAGSATAYNPAFWSLTADYYREDRQAHDICCYNTSSSDYCNMYYELRPIGECTTRIPFRFSWTWGDPHIKTLDGGEYTFNGWGEYIMISMTTPSLTFTLQGRTGLAQTEKGTVANATVFTAFGAQENGVRVTVDLDPNTNDTLIIYGNGTDYTMDFYQNGNDFMIENEAYLLKNTNSSLEVRFTSGIQLTISIGYKSLDISVTMPLEFQSQTKGLLGNFNGVKDDDFILPDGTTLNSDLTDRQIYETFGPRWAVTEANTVLRYPPREGPANYTHPQFQPIFLDEQPADVRQKAEELCGAANLACVYDYVATGSETFATSTNKTASSANRTETVSKNTVPVLKFNNTVSVTSGSTATFNLQGHDPDEGDSLTYHVVGNPGRSVVVDRNSGNVTLHLDSSSPVSLSFYAVDSHNVQSPKRDVTIIICPPCSGHGTCDVINAVASNVTGFMIAPCNCGPAWTGPDCSKDYDACLEHPCSNQQVCTDLTPTQQGVNTTGFTCTECGKGYVADTADPTSCIDIDECAGTNNCTNRCINLPGYFECGCDVGYRMKDDGVTCDDINECADRTAGCQQDCVNTVGSFNCTCFTGYKLTLKGMCEPDQATAELCSQAGCAHGCTTETDPVSGNTIPSCFCNAGYAPSPSNASACVDVDECSQDFCSQACTNTVGSFACTCYSGHLLGADQRTCTPCQGLRYGPECRLTCTCNGHATRCDPVTGCVCTSGWTGSQCERDVDECTENPDVCGSQQICSNTQGSYVCNCPAGYKKDAAGNCEDINECAEGYLKTTCGELETCHNVEGSYYCSCISGYRRKLGQCVDVDECSGSTQRCEQLCINRPGSFNCDCYYGYRLDQERTNCVQVGDVCKEFEGLDCDQGCTLNDNNVAVCFCNAGYKLASDGETCLDMDECTSGVANCSDTCINTPGSFNCTCPVGKTLDNDGKTCQDCPTGSWGKNCINKCECDIGATGCDAATGCECMSGWTGAHCDQDVNECDTASAQLECQAVSAECYNFQGGYRCQCPQGYKKNSAGVCQDIDECASSPCSQLCENTPGSFRCLCNKGYRLNVTTGACQDINECALSFTNNCTQRCVNTPGGYRCDCSVAGFQLQNDGFTCKASSTCNRIDCPIENGGCSQEQCFCNSRYSLSADQSSCNFNAVDYCRMAVCEQTCANSPDGTSYTCSCRNGYLLNSDKSTCRECRDGTYGPGCTQNCACNTRNSLSCNKQNGTCTCMAGWKGVTCDDDIDECSPPSSTTCIAHAHCVNIKGGHLCSCDTGFTKVDGNCIACDPNHYGENCAQRCDCSVNSVSCDKVSGKCSCKAGWEGARCDVDVDECTLGGARCSGDHVVCVNTDGGFSCDCDKGYTRNGTDCVDKDECFTKESDCLHECNNTIGGYVCSCGQEYQGTGNDCTELAQESILLTVDIPVPASDLANPYSQTYKDWVGRVQQVVYGEIKPSVPGLKVVIIRSLRHGSLVSDTGFVLDTQTEPNSISALSAAIMAMIREQLTLGTYTGNVSVSIHGIMVSENMTLCDVYETFNPCGTSQECQENSGIASCGPSTEESEDDDLGLIIGLAVAIPVVLLIAGVIALAVYFHKRSNVHTLPLINHDEVYGVAPAPSNLYGGKPGVGPADTHLRAPSPVSASPVPSLDSIEPSVDSRPPSRQGSWVANM